VKVAASPASTAQHSPTHNEPIYPDSQRILIVDDHALNRMVASATILQQMPNALIDEAKNGTEAVAKMSSNVYDIVLMDLVMPDMSGVDVVRKIRKDCPAPFCNVQVAAFTANLAEDAIQECRSVGMQDILSKPLNKESLFQVIRQAT
jgi:CheY-like chemotaxis protein